MKSLGKTLILFFLGIFGLFVVGYYSGVIIFNILEWLDSDNGLFLLLLTVPILLSAGTYFFIKFRKKALEGRISEEERMLEPFYEADTADKFRVVMSVFLLGALFVVIVYLVTSGLAEPFRSIAVWISLGLLLVIVVIYGLMFFQKTRLQYERLEIYLAPAVIFGVSAFSIFLLMQVEDLPSPQTIHFGYIALSLFSVFALIAGVKLLLTANRSIYDKKAKAEEELNFASEVQQQFLNDRVVDTNIISAFGTSRAAREVGGDFLYLEELEDQTVVAAIGDVSGHSFGAGLIMSMLTTLTEAHMVFTGSPKGLMENLNRRLLNQPKRNLFATMGCLQIDNDKVTLWNAGHMPVLKYSATEAELTKILPPGFALGMTNKAEYKESEVSLKKGDFLILYSDGLVETRDNQGKIREEEHFYLAVESVLEKENTSESVAKAILENVLEDDFSDYPEDDLTIIVIHIKNGRAGYILSK